MRQFISSILIVSLLSTHLPALAATTVVDGPGVPAPRFMGPKNFVNGLTSGLYSQPEHIAMGSLGFMVGSVIQCFGKATVSNDKILYRGCVDILTEVDQAMGLLAFSFASGITTSALQALIYSPHNISKWKAIMLERNTLEFKMMAESSLLEKVSLNSKVARASIGLGSIKLLPGISMTLGSLMQHKFDKWWRTEERKNWWMQIREQGYWSDRKEKVRLDQKIVMNAIRVKDTGNLKQEAMAAVNTALEDFKKDLILRSPFPDKPGSKYPKDVEDTKQTQFIITNLEKFIKTPFEKWTEPEVSQSGDILGVYDQLMTRYEAKRALVSDQREESWGKAWDKMQKESPAEAEEFKTNTIQMVLTTFIVAAAESAAVLIIKKGVSGLSWAKKMAVSEVQDDLTRYTISQTPTKEEFMRSHLTSKNGVVNEQALKAFMGFDEKQQFDIVKQIILKNERENMAQLMAKGEKALPTFTGITKSVKRTYNFSKADKIYAQGRVPKIFSSRGWFKPEFTSDEYKAARAELSSGRKIFLKGNRFSYVILAGAFSAVIWLSGNELLSEKYTTFGYDHKMDLKKVWGVGSALGSSCNLIRLCDEGVINLEGGKVSDWLNSSAGHWAHLDTLENRIKLAQSKVVTTFVEAFRNSKETQLKVAAQEKVHSPFDEEGIAMDPWMSFLSQTPQVYRAAVLSLRDYDDVFKKYAEEVILRKFNLNYRDFEARYGKLEEDNHKILQYLRWQSRINEIKRKAAAGDAAAKKKFNEDPNGYTDIGFMFNGNTNPELDAQFAPQFTDPSSGLYGEVAGRPWHLDPTLFRHSFEEEIKKIKDTIASTSFMPEDYTSSKVVVYGPDVLAKLNDKNIPDKEKTRLRVEYTALARERAEDLIKLFEAKFNRESSAQVDEFQSLMNDEVSRLIPAGRISVNGKVPAGPLENNLEQEFKGLREISYQITAQLSPAERENSAAFIQLVGALNASETKAFGTSFENQDLYQYLKAVVPQMAGLTTDFLAEAFGVGPKGSFNDVARGKSIPPGINISGSDGAGLGSRPSTFEDGAGGMNFLNEQSKVSGIDKLQIMTSNDLFAARGDALTLAIAVAVSNLRQHFKDIPFMRKSVLSLNFETLRKCGGPNTGSVIRYAPTTPNAQANIFGADDSSTSSDAGCWEGTLTQ